MVKSAYCPNFGTLSRPLAKRVDHKAGRGFLVLHGVRGDVMARFGRRGQGQIITYQGTCTIVRNPIVNPGFAKPFPWTWMWMVPHSAMAAKRDWCRIGVKERLQMPT